eukprot:gene17885-36933_t
MRCTPTRRWIQRRARRRMLLRLEKEGMQCPAAADVETLGPPEPADPAVTYPKYYLREYHAYPEGNLCWEAAVEAEAMSVSAAMVAYPEKGAGACRHMHDLAVAALP